MTDNHSINLHIPLIYMYFRHLSVLNAFLNFYFIFLSLYFFPPIAGLYAILLLVLIDADIVKIPIKNK